MTLHLSQIGFTDARTFITVQPSAGTKPAILYVAFIRFCLGQTIPFLPAAICSVTGDDHLYR